MKKHHFIFIAFISIIILSEAKAQISSGIGPSMPNASAASYYYISKPGELTMQVNIWGAVQKPGRYEVPTSTDLVQLVSYAGGPNPDAVIDEVKVARVVKEAEKYLRSEYYVDLEDLSSTTTANLELKPGDTIFFDRSNWAKMSSYLTVITTVAVITTAVANVILVERGIRR